MTWRTATGAVMILFAFLGCCVIYRMYCRDDDESNPDESTGRLEIGKGLAKHRPETNTIDRQQVDQAVAKAPVAAIRLDQELQRHASRRPSATPSSEVYTV